MAGPVSIFAYALVVWFFDFDHFGPLILFYARSSLDRTSGCLMLNTLRNAIDDFYIRVILQ